MGVQWVVVVIMILLLMASRRDQSVILVVVSEAPPPEPPPPPHPLLGCKEEEDYMCGNVPIPYPFGTTLNCSRSYDFHITCNHTTNPPKPFFDTDNYYPVLAINISSSELRVSTYVASNCYFPNGTHNFDISFYTRLHLTTTFTVSSSRNKFTAIGCDNAAFISDEEEERFSSGCVSICYSINSTAAAGGNCSGMGCCQTQIPDGLSGYTIHTTDFVDHNSTIDFNPCSYAFVVEEDEFEFNPDFLRNFTEERVPTVLEWVVDNKTCEDAIKEPQSYGCKADNSTCSYSKINRGYRCNCEPGFTGNPYLTNGCQDVDECKLGLHNCKQICNNLIGNYSCSCDKGYRKDEANQGNCIRPGDDEKVLIVKVVAGICIIILLLLVGFYMVYLGIKRRKHLKCKSELFVRNGGLMLIELKRREERHDSSSSSSIEAAKIFRIDELNKATKCFDKSTIIGEGGFGTVHKGVLPDSGLVVAIKKSKVNDQRQIDQFIKEVIVLSKINHRNVVKLLGCCLEYEVPLLVYEFVTNGTLNHHLHEQGSIILPWKDRLRIAKETAIAISYLHSETSTPIIHRDIKPSNILLDDKLTAKVSDFGASRLVALDKAQVTTLVQGTLGYLDPEYFQTSQLTEKSDVYSFGVVLVEILTGKEALSFDRPEKEKSLANYFNSAMKDNRLFEIVDHEAIMDTITGIVNNNNATYKEEHQIIIGVAKLARRCLSMTGEERPTMKQVEMELERLASGNIIHNQQENEETQHLLGTIEYGKAPTINIYN